VALIEELESMSQEERLPLVMGGSYYHALVSVEKETGLLRRIFPVDCPYSLKQTLGISFYPNEDNDEN
jgi:hypothetical protein